MGDVLSDGLAALPGLLKQYAGRTVLYRRGGDSVELTATVGRTEWERADEDGLVRTWQSRDYVLAAEDLVLAGEPATPARGDQIVETIDGAEHVFRVLPAGGTDVYRWVDAGRRLLRVHTIHGGEA